MFIVKDSDHLPKVFPSVKIFFHQMFEKSVSIKISPIKILLYTVSKNHALQILFHVAIIIIHIVLMQVEYITKIT